MKGRLYIRAAKSANAPRRLKLAAHTSPNFRPLTEVRDGADVALPTAHFPIELDIPDSMLEPREVSGRLEVDPATGDIQIIQPEEEPDGQQS